MGEREENEDFFEDDGIYDAVEDGKTEIMAEAERLRQKIRRVLKGSADGRDVADYIIKELCGFDRSSFSRNALEMAREVGKREVALVLTQILDWEPIPEAHRERESFGARLARALCFWRRRGGVGGF